MAEYFIGDFMQGVCEAIMENGEMVYLELGGYVKPIRYTRIERAIRFLGRTLGIGCLSSYHEKVPMGIWMGDGRIMQSGVVIISEEP